jgi:DinB superfamily
MNPYASYVGNRDPFEVIAGTAQELRNLIESIGPQRVEQAPAPGKWSPREIVCHLADCEIAFGFRLRQALAEDHHVIQPFDQELWARSYAAYTTAEALTAFSALRQWDVRLVRSLTPQQLAKQVTHPERGTMTVKTIVDTMAGHDINHLRQLEAVAARASAASVAS